MEPTIIKMQIRFEQDIALCRQRSRILASLLNCDVPEQTRIATAVSELARNTFLYARSGEVVFTVNSEDPPVLTIQVIDHGPGISNLATVLAGNATGVAGQPCNGILGAKRLMDHFTIASSPSGTKVTISKILNRHSGALRPKERLHLLDDLLRQQPLDPLEEMRAQNKELLLALETLQRGQEELSQAKEDALRANKSKSVFLANMSHEIRTPLGVILGYTELLKDPKLPPDERSSFLETVERHGRELTRLIDDILDMSKVEAGHLKIERSWVDLPSLLSDLMTTLRPKAEEKGLQLILRAASDLPASIWTDETRLRQILGNMVGNALKFTCAGRVTVEVERLKGEPYGSRCKLRFRIEDTGIGIPAEKVAHLFQPFAQADNSIAQRFGGSGLGLALTRQLAILLGGTAELVRSVPGVGSTFEALIEAELPKTREHEGATRAGLEESAVSPPTHPLAGISFLVAEDAPDNRFLIKRILTNNGASVDLVENGEEALRQARSQSYDVILMDIQMPIVDGYSATKLLRHSGYRGVIIALTAYAMADDRRRCLEAGCNDQLTKPINKSKLIQTVLRHSTKSHAAAASKNETAPTRELN